MRKLYILLLTLLPFISFSQSIDHISPNNATKGESIVLTITSTNTLFKSGTNTIKLINPSFPVINANSVIVVNDTMLQAAFSFNNNYSRGKYDVVVGNSEISFPLTLPKAFELKNKIPVALSVLPSSAKQTDTVELTVKSQNTHFSHSSFTRFMLLDPQNTIQLIDAFSIVIVNDTTIAGKFAFNYNHAVMSYDVVIQSSSDQTITLEKSFQLQPGPFLPEIVSITPNSAYKLDSSLVTIKGRNLFFKRDSAIIYLSSPFGGIAPEKINYINDSVVTLFFRFTNVAPSSSFNVVVWNSMGTFNFKNAFTLHDALKPPSLISVDPLEAKQGDSTLIKIKGKHTHFLKSKNVYVTLINVGLGATSVQVVNDTLMQAKLNFTYRDKPGSYVVSTYNDVDGELTAPGTFNLKAGGVPPQLLEVSPNSAVQGERVNVLIKGTKNCFSSFNPSSVFLTKGNYSLYIPELKIVNDSTLLATLDLMINNTIIDTYDLEIYGYLYGDYIRLNLPGSFTLKKNLNPPLIISVSPDSGTQFDTVRITVKARGTHFLYKNTLLSMSYGNSSLQARNVVAINDSTVQGTLDLNANYYPDAVVDILTQNVLDGIVVKNKAFTIKRLYDHEPKIIAIDPKSSSPGYSVTVNITGVKQTFRPGNIAVQLYYPSYPSINASTVTYVNDSLITAYFSFPDTARLASYYYLIVNNVATLWYMYFSLYDYPSKLTGMTPAFASQTDTITATITGSKTHFNSSSDQIWLRSKYGTVIKSYSIQAANDSSTVARFAFSNNHLPGAYTLYLKSAVDKTTMKLNNAFTLTGTLNTTSLVNVWPKYTMCDSRTSFTIKGNNTYFLAEADTIQLASSNVWGNSVIYPSKMKIVNDETITADFSMPCGTYDVIVLGKENYVLEGQLMAVPPVTIQEVNKEELLKIFPNPSNGIFEMKVAESLLNGQLSVFDGVGKLVLSIEKISESVQLDLSDYSNGIYFVKVVNDTTYNTMKIIKQ